MKVQVQDDLGEWDWYCTRAWHWWEDGCGKWIQCEDAFEAVLRLCVLGQKVRLGL